MKEVSTIRIVSVSLITGFLLNLTGWIANYFLLGKLWSGVSSSIEHSPWRNTVWRHLFSFLPDFVYGFAIAWLIVLLNKKSNIKTSNSISSGLWISLVGGITTYFAIANSGFIPWDLALASFILVLATKVPLAILAGKLLYR